MTITARVRGLLGARGIVVGRRENLRFGTDELLDVKRLLPHVDVVLDVGANEGQTALAFAAAFREARIYAFEPIPATFSTLEAATKNEARITCFEMALGSTEGEATIRLRAKSGHNSLLHVAEPGPGAVTVTVTTGDSWASAHGVDRVDLLKIDTEGFEVEVLTGFDGFLGEGRVECVLAECEFERVTKEPHTSFFDLYEHLAGHGLRLVTLYTDAVWTKQFARGNALFMRSGA